MVIKPILIFSLLMFSASRYEVSAQIPVQAKDSTTAEEGDLMSMLEGEEDDSMLPPTSIACSHRCRA